MRRVKEILIGTVLAVAAAAHVALIAKVASVAKFSEPALAIARGTAKTLDDALNLLHVFGTGYALRANTIVHRAFFSEVLPYYEMLFASLVVLTSIALVCFLVPILYRLLARRKLCVFISYYHRHTKLAVRLRDALLSSGFNASMLLYRKGAEHQSIVGESIAEIRNASIAVCLPGPETSYVDHEVAAASGASKLIVFLLSAGSTLPNTADKRYPVFLLKESAKKEFAPLLEFLHYVGGDLRSGISLLRLCGHGGIPAPLPFVVSLGAISTIVVLLACVSISNGLAQHAVAGAPLLTLWGSFWASFAVFVLIVVVIVGTSLGIGSFVHFWCRQLLSRRRAFLQTVHGNFDARTWIKKIPHAELSEMIAPYLYKGVLLAHHERDGPHVVARVPRKPAKG